MRARQWIARTLGFIAVVVLTGGAPAVTQELRIGLAAAATEVIRLASDAPAASVAFHVTDATSVVFDAVASAPNVQMALVSPGGTRFDESTIGTIGGTARRGFVQPNTSGPLISPTESPGDHITFTIPAPAQGTWTLEFGSPAGNSDEIAVIVTMLLETRTVASLITLPGKLVLGDAVSLNLAAFSEDQPVTGATVQADIVAPGGAVSRVSLLDNGVLPDRTSGDGLYAAGFVPQETGTFDVLAVLTGVSPTTGAAVRREAAATFDVVPPTLALLGAVATRTVDLNFNGLIDQLFLDVGVNVLQPGAFVVTADLLASNGMRLTRGGTFDLTSADSVVPVLFTAEDVRGLGVDGPYRIGPIEIVFRGAQGAQPADREDDGGQTPPLTLAQFEQAAIRFAGSSRDTGVDLNGNALFDRLDVELDMVFARQGFYQWSAILFDSDGTQIGFAAGTGVQAAGPGVIRLSFGGAAIGANGANGPYTIGNLLVSGGGTSLLMLQVANTAGYTARQFEGFVGNEPPVARALAAESTECSSQAGAAVKLDGSTSSDPDGDPLTFEWRDSSGAVVGTGAIVTLPLALGSHAFTLTVGDGNGGSDSDTVTVAVVDTTAPSVTAVTPTPDVIWPPDHRMQPVEIAITAADTCTAAPVCRITAVSSNEPQGPSESDWLITGDLALNLRAEREGSGSGRRYSIAVTCTDAAGNAAQGTTAVVVPHDQK